MNLIVNPTTLSGVKLCVTDRFEDYRGDIGGVYDEKLYRQNGINVKFVYDMVSTSYKGVLRGLHASRDTHKLIQCLYGTLYYVIVDVNEQSSEFGKWQSFILSDSNHQQIYIPPMHGGGLYALSEKTILTYKLSSSYSENQLTFAWNDPRFGIRWPIGEPILAARDDILPKVTR
ncbi:MAG: dTDP-4-dehydrorhamnose 3,5-epimerase family protein [Treponema sp.]|jgi:dTDP-4-dehydrorhamnose 3,5-epimerase|nr:dTDP-4-dehydrorhamnose 3,5-epimerase family protein [Treponema sp.]